MDTNQTANPVASDLLAGNDLPARWRGQQRFVILDTAFGDGLPFLTIWQAWRNDPQPCQRLHYLAFCPGTPPPLDSLAHTPPALAALATELNPHWPPATPGLHRLHLDGGQVILTLIRGEITSQLRLLTASVDAFFLHAPPSDDLPAFAKSLGRLAAPGARLATPALSSELRAALSTAEFDIAPTPNSTGTTPCYRGHFRSRRPSRHPVPSDRRAIVIGAGIAGSTAAHALARAGWQVTVLEAGSAPATGASSNLAGVLRPLPSADDNRLSRLTRAGYLATRALLAALPEARWSACGVLHLGREASHEAQQKKAVERLDWPPEVLAFVDAATASQRLAWPVETGGWWFPGGGWVQPPSVCQAALTRYPERISVQFNTDVAQLQGTETGWQALDSAGMPLAEAPVLVIAAGAAAPRLAPLAWLPQRAARGQVTHLPASATPPLPHVVCKLGYAMPEVDGLRLIGATHQTGDDDPSVRIADHRENLARLNLSLPGLAGPIDPTNLPGRVGFRPMSPDRLPIVGPVPAAVKVGRHTRLHELPRLPGLWCVQGFGARGIVWSALMADLLVSQIEGEPLPLENDLVDALDPGRFLLKPERRPTQASTGMD